MVDNKAASWKNDEVAGSGRDNNDASMTHDV
jgi:hypothetical protein